MSKYIALSSSRYNGCVAEFLVGRGDLHSKDWILVKAYGKNGAVRKASAIVNGKDLLERRLASGEIHLQVLG